MVKISVCFENPLSLLRGHIRKTYMKKIFLHTLTFPKNDIAVKVILFTSPVSLFLNVSKHSSICSSVMFLLGKVAYP